MKKTYRIKTNNQELLIRRLFPFPFLIHQAVTKDLTSSFGQKRFIEDKGNKRRVKVKTSKQKIITLYASVVTVLMLEEIS